MDRKNPGPRKGNTKMQGEKSSKGGMQQRQLKTQAPTKICTQMFSEA